MVYLQLGPNEQLLELRGPGGVGGEGCGDGGV